MKYNLTINKKTLFEYSVITLSVSLFAISAYLLFGNAVKDYVTESRCEITNQVFVHGERIGKGYCN